MYKEYIIKKCVEAIPGIAGRCSSCGKANPQITDQCEMEGLPHTNVRPRSITLADVLFAINKTTREAEEPSVAVEVSGTFIFVYMETQDWEFARREMHDETVCWDLLNDNLENQSPKVHEFLYERLEEHIY